MIGVVLGVAGGRLHRVVPGGVTARFEGIYAIRFGLAAFGLADVTFGNGLIAAFVAGITLGFSEHEIAERFADFSENLSTIFQVLTFFVFGAIIVATGWDASLVALALFIAFALLVARPVAVARSLAGTALPRPQKAFIAWFGPKGVASGAVRDPGPRRRPGQRLAGLRHRRLRDPRLDRRPRPHRHRRRALDRAADGRLSESAGPPAQPWASFSTTWRAVSGSTSVNLR